ncbi:hypothetical protein DXG03_009738, partial [Asterophora parasitica]
YTYALIRARSQAKRNLRNENLSWKPPKRETPKMPMVNINPKTGPAEVHYTISTPSCPSADRIDPKLPTVIFIHPVYIGQIIYQRRDNLYTFRRSLMFPIQL